VRPLIVGAAKPRGSASVLEKTREQRVEKMSFSRHTELSGVHQIGTVHSPVLHQPND
jgi:hypothetical protein